jgi:glycosyltransferase involved in cell wall biosynthesis
VKILLVNNFYYNRGGDCTYLFSLKKLLEEKGHKVIVFSMHHPLNFKSQYSKYFVSHIDYAEESKKMSISSGFRVLFRSIYSAEARKKMEKLIKDEKPDIVHLNNIRHHLTPSILYPMKSSNIPVVWTLHDYQLICPNISFLAAGKVCERCKKRKYFWPAISRCKKGSFLASTMAAIEHSFQIITKVYGCVDAFICPTDFLKNKYEEYGFYEQKLTVLNHFIDSDSDSMNAGAGDYVLYIGRLSEEKGLITLIDAVAKEGSCKLKIVGNGSFRDKLSEYVELKHLKERVELVGYKTRIEVMEIIKKCKFLVIPSEWYEVSGLVILEAYACGKPVIGSRIGGIPENIQDGETGYLFEPGNSDELCEKISYMTKNHDKVQEMGEAAKKYINHKFNSEKHYSRLMDIYRKVLERKR